MKRQLVDRDQPDIPQEWREKQRILDGYELMDLLKVASSNENTRAIVFVHIAYIKNFGDKEVHFDLHSTQRQITELPDHILVEGHGMCLLYVRLFNRAIFKILIMCNGDSNSIYRIFNENLSKHCVNSLRSIAFKCAQLRPITLQGFQGRFEKVKTVRLENVNLGGQLPELANLFPNVGRLVLQDVSMLDNGVRFQLLQVLEIGYAAGRTCVRLNEVRSLLRSNRTLLRLLIVMPNVDDMNMEFLLDIIGEKRFLLELIVKTKVVDEPVQAEQVERLIRSYEFLEKLDLNSFRMVRDYATFLWEKLPSLRLFLTRIVKYVNDAPIQENRLLTRFVRTDTGYEIAAPITRIRRMPQDDPVTFKRRPY